MPSSIVKPSSSSPPAPRVELRPLDEADLEILVGYLREPSVARWWGRERTDEECREDLRTGPDEEAFTILVDGEVAGWLNSSEETEPDYRMGGLDLMLGEAYQGRGIGRRALILAARRLFGERGHHRIMIDPSAANDRAIRCYESIGFKRVGVMRRYGRRADGVWEDGLLLDLLAEELIEPS